ncbi:MAG: GIY-YIG nuclease family protein [Candidatus Omnitrophica bacterium]|nr:GIY-YIG nuclease family protein [Candidatus Omnitrophota bacterium]
MYYVYVLENNLGKHYMGSCKELEKRVRRHNQNSVRSTKNKGPFKVIHKEEYFTKTEARKREFQIKSYRGNSKFKRLIESPSSSLV